MATIQDRRHRRLEELSVTASRAFVESGLHGIEAEVVVALDVSPRMAPLYAQGLVQNLATALLALAMKFDDDGSVPVWCFDAEARHLGEIKRQDYANWVRSHVPTPALPDPEGPADSRSSEAPAAARYAPMIDAIGRRYFPKEWAAKGAARVVGDKLKRQVIDYPGPIEPRPFPVFVIIVTSGDCADALETTRLLRRASHLPIFWQFAGLQAPSGPTAGGAAPRFHFLRGVDKLTDTHCDCAGFFEPGDPGDADMLFAGLLNELPRWLALPEVRAMLQPTTPATEGKDALAGLDSLLVLPPVEAAKREATRAERERRRQERATNAAAELEQAAAWPTIRNDAEADPARESDPVTQVRAGAGLARRINVGTRPYIPSDGEAPVLPPRRPTVSFAAFVEPAPSAHDDDDETTVETAIERLARIRARRNARKE